jgi:hypothetical protein
MGIGGKGACNDHTIRAWAQAWGALCLGAAHLHWNLQLAFFGQPIGPARIPQGIWVVVDGTRQQTLPHQQGRRLEGTPAMTAGFLQGDAEFFAVALRVGFLPPADSQAR